MLILMTFQMYYILSMYLKLFFYCAISPSLTYTSYMRGSNHHDTLDKLNIAHPHQAEDVEEHEHQGAIIKDENSGRKSYSRSSPHAQMLAQFSEGYEHATRQIMDEDEESGRFKRDVFHSSTSFPQSSRSLDFIQQIRFDRDTDLALQELFGKCIIPEFKCNPGSRFRSYSGNCNNLFNPSLGSHLTEFGRILPAEYDDQVSSPRQNSFLPHK